MICPSCKALVQPDEEYCGNCGSPVKAAIGQQDPTVPANQGNSWRDELGRSPLFGTTPTPGATASSPATYPVNPSYQQPYLQPINPMSPIGLHVPSSGKAIISLIVGIANLLLFLGIFIIPGIVAVVLGHMARAEIRQRGGQLGGNGMALAGLILGYIGIALGILILIYANHPPY